MLKVCIFDKEKNEFIYIDNVRAYNFETRFIRYHRDELTQEEYDLVSRVVKEIGKDDC